MLAPNVTSGLSPQMDVVVGSCSTVDKLTLFTFLVVLVGSSEFRWNRGRPFIKKEINF